LTTKAVHLEPVTDLTTEAFMASLKRFVARRGCPARMITDNGLNFVGAHNTLNEVQRLLNHLVLNKASITTAYNIRSNGLILQLEHPILEVYGR